MTGWGLTVIPAFAGIQGISCILHLTFRNLSGFRLKAGMTVKRARLLGKPSFQSCQTNRVPYSRYARTAVPWNKAARSVSEKPRENCLKAFQTVV